MKCFGCFENDWFVVYVEVGVDEYWVVCFFVEGL